MQALLNNLDPMIAIILIVAGVIALVIVVILTRRLRRRQPSLDDPMGAPPGLSGQVDYTSLPLDDGPSGWRERFANLSLAGKILIVLVPLLVLLGVLVLVLTLMSGNNEPPPVAVLPTPAPPVTLTVTKADVIRISPVTISVAAETTGLEDATKVTVELLAYGQPIPYLAPDETTGQVQGGRVKITAHKLDDAAAPSEGPVYRVRVSTADGQATSEMDLTVPLSYARTFFGTAGAETSATAETGTASATAAPGATAEPAATPSPAPLSGPEVAISNGGNVRALPIVTPNNRVGGVDAGNKVQLLEQTPNGAWYHISFINTDDGQRKDGWISASLLSVANDVLAKVEVATIVSVFVEGTMYEKPDTASPKVDKVNVDEVVSLKQKTAAGDWYQVENVRGTTGWVPANLLGIPEDVAAKVSVARPPPRASATCP